MMVSTHNTQHIISFQKDYYTVTFNDKRTFNLIAKSQEVALDAILCEKGRVLIDIILQGTQTGLYCHYRAHT